MAAKIVLDDHRGYHGAAHMGPGLDGLHRAGHGGVDRCTQPRGDADYIAEGHAVPHRHDAAAGRTDMLHQRNGHPAGRYRADVGGKGQFLASGRMDAAEEGVLHVSLLPALAINS